jgi:hypothetical protein
MVQKPHLYRDWTRDPIRPVTIITMSIKIVMNTVEVGTGVMRRSVRSKSGVVMVQSMYRAYHMERVG